MTVVLTIQKYRKRYIFFALLSMALFHFTLLFSSKISFYKLMGSGKNGTFDKNPDWQQWVILAAFKNDIQPENFDKKKLIRQLYGRFINRWLQFFGVQTTSIFLTPLEGHGKWDGKIPFEFKEKNYDHKGQIAVLTRATIRISKLIPFWSNVPAVANKMQNAAGLISSIGIGEIPFIKQATFSIWENKELMKQFAYTMQEHKNVITKTRKENWYKEEMFVRFAIIKSVEL
ncbi:spheroidene monooxygenase [Ferruginibacter sp. SUN002]|uniref:spheroidene monooxygenase n=1 Tax=Ferruginibacter sp. SUN002 TaxID=2937789 RepID=UPI003D35D825